jgi:HPt (histidine-containing phosphotransfer) domain-containing protein
MHVLNRENLIDATDGDLSMEAMLYQSFFKTSGEYMATIKGEPTTDDRARALHSLKGLALNMGAEALGELCRRFEVEPLDLESLDRIYQQTCTEMQQIVDQAG